MGGGGRERRPQGALWLGLTPLPCDRGGEGRVQSAVVLGPVDTAPPPPSSRCLLGMVPSASGHRHAAGLGGDTRSGWLAWCGWDWEWRVIPASTTARRGSWRVRSERVGVSRAPRFDGCARLVQRHGLREAGVGPSRPARAGEVMGLVRAGTRLRGSACVQRANCKGLGTSQGGCVCPHRPVPNLAPKGRARQGGRVARVECG